jgi:hypothetical protein
MMRDILFLLSHDFRDGPGGPFYCPECAQLTGVIGYYPALRHLLDIRHVDFRRPRQAIVDLIGEANQSCPVLVITSAHLKVVEGMAVGTVNDRHFVYGGLAIGNYLAMVYGVGRPH